MGVISNMPAAHANITQTTIESITLLDTNGKRTIVYLANDARIHHSDKTLLQAIRIAEGKFT